MQADHFIIRDYTLVAEAEFIDHQAEVQDWTFAKILLKVFKFFDSEIFGFARKEISFKFMKQQGENIKEFELEMMIKSAVDPLNKKFTTKETIDLRIWRFYSQTHEMNPWLNVSCEVSYVNQINQIDQSNVRVPVKF